MAQFTQRRGILPPRHQPFTGIRRIRIALALALALFVGLAGQHYVFSQAGTPQTSPVASPTAVVTPAPDAPRLVLDFETLNDSGLTGTATLYEAGDQTIVDLDVKNTGDDQPAHIHAGQCGSLTAEPAFDLTSLHADGTSRTVIDTPLDGLLNGEFAIDIHLSPTELGTLSACANIEGTPTVPSESTAVATPSAEATGTGGESTTPTVPPTTSSSTATSVATATATSEATATATTTTSGSTSTNGDGTGGNTGTTSTTTGGTTSATTTSGSSTTTTTSATTGSAGDGTGDGASTSNGSIYLATDGTVKTADMAASGTGPLGIVPERMDPTIFWAILSAAVLLLISSVWIWFGERRLSQSHRQPPRWSRLGM